MKKILFLFSLTLLSIYTFANPIKISVCKNETVHLIFGADIKYFSTVTKFVVADNPKLVKNVLRIKATEQYDGLSSLVVATSDSHYYTFQIAYNKNLDTTNYFISANKIKNKRPQHIYINKENQIHLIFPKAIKYLDHGSRSIQVFVPDAVSNILRVVTNEIFNKKTNVSVITEDNKFYTYNVSYGSQASNNYSIFADNRDTIILNQDLTDEDKSKIIKQIDTHLREIYYLGFKKNKIEFSVNNIFVYNNRLIFRFEIQNTSNIKYDIEYIKFYIEDKKKNKRAASQSTEIPPLFINNFQPMIMGKNRNVFSVCFKKFTIPDDKIFKIEINEKNGGRHIIFSIPNKDIINANNL